MIKQFTPLCFILLLYSGILHGGSSPDVYLMSPSKLQTSFKQPSQSRAQSILKKTLIALGLVLSFAAGYNYSMSKVKDTTTFHEESIKSLHGISVPVNYRICDKSDNKTKNDYFREMLEEVLHWGLSPCWVTGDAWYASTVTKKFCGFTQECTN